jgi:LPS sulfotransferase NodH
VTSRTPAPQSFAAGGAATSSARSRAPVFVVGSPRSGTTLLYHMLLSAGRFAIYRAETHVFNVLAPRFGDARTAADRAAMTDAFIRSDMFRVSGLEQAAFRADIERSCRNPGDFLRLFMEAICRTQVMDRWAETTPVHVLHVREIKATIPEALFIHVVRDGRDVAVSMMKQGWVRPFPWHREAPERAAGAFWAWVVEAGERASRGYERDFLRVRYEDLTAAPQPTLDRIAAFVDQPLVHEEILRAGVGSVSRPNTSFPGQTSSFHGRWKAELTESRARALEAMLAPVLARQGYDVGGAFPMVDRSRGGASMAAYRAWFGARQAFKHTPVGRRLVSLELFEPGAVRPEYA